MINHELLLINNMAKFKQQSLNKKEDTEYLPLAVFSPSVCSMYAV